MMKKFIFLLVVSATILSGCGYQGVPQEKTVTAVPVNTVMINHFIFEPSELTVAVGTTVTWKHNDSVAHTIVSPNVFESKVLNRGDNFTFTFTAPGEYNYHCSIHPSMTGKIIVK